MTKETKLKPTMDEIVRFWTKDRGSFNMELYKKYLTKLKTR